MTETEKKIREDLHRYLLSIDKVGEVIQKTPDIDGKWEEILHAYLPDGVREYTSYPTVSLGWMMYIGMAVAALWDKHWDEFCALDDIYLHFRDRRGYDAMDEYICEEILDLDSDGFTATEKLVGECASRTNSQLCHAPVEPGTKEAFEAYVGALRQLYLMGAAVQLNVMGYGMVKVENKQ